jgi:hypothetical protein
MQVRCIKAFGVSAVGRVVDIPDGASVDPEHWEAVPGEPPATTPAPKPPATVTPAAAVTPKEGA